MSEDQNSAETEIVAASLSDGAYTLFVADFSETDMLVVRRDADGTLEVQKATDHSTKHGFRWGLVGGVALGVLFPPSIIGSAAALGAAGAAAGKVRQRHHHRELEAELQDSIAPGHSGILALVSDPGVIEIRKALDKADAIVEKAVDKVAAQDMKAAAEEAEAEEEA